jgi:hypothetical protein
MPTSPELSGRGGPALAVSLDGCFVYVACGYSGEENDDVHIFNLKTKEWRVCVPAGSGVFEARSVVGSCTLPESQGGGIVIFGGETATSTKGHDGAGNFTNDVVHICPATSSVCVAAGVGEAQPCVRGWTAIASWEEGGDGGAVMFGGLTGDDESPVRLADTWQLRLKAAV